jgi:glucose/mannose-6-phosphate isomerase
MRTLAREVEPLSPEAIGLVDSYGLIDDVLAQPDHFRDALRRLDRVLVLAPHDRPGGMLVCGMGGSAIGADLARAAIGDRARRPIRTVRDYAPEPWLTPDTLVVCASYSGNTEETLAAYAQAGAAGAERVAVTTGGALADAARADGVPIIDIPAGLQPRAAVAYMTSAVLECAYRCGAAPPMRADVTRTIDLLEQLITEWGPDAGPDCEPKQLAHALRGAVPVIYGAGATAAVARRWKAQINENAKTPAFDAVLPEADHNEICAWERADGRFAAVFLDDGRLPERLERRVELTAGLVAASGATMRRIRARGDGPLERVLSLVFLGDLVSVYMAVLDGIDPTPVDQIERFKKALG